MTGLRRLLGADRPDLLEALERSWAIAHEEWLPVLSPTLDSCNSYPHLRNCEAYLGQVVDEYAALHGASDPPLLTSLDAYVLLSAILFHDIGRLQGGDPHGLRSQNIVKSEHAKLGIPSVVLAEVIGRVVAFRDLPPDQGRRWMQGHLSTVMVSPHGHIRQRLCAALLFLVDHMDAAYTRVPPLYATAKGSYQVVGAFRRAVRGVAVDLSSQMVKVALSSDLHGEGGPQCAEASRNASRFWVDTSLLSETEFCIGPDPQGGPWALRPRKTRSDPVTVPEKRREVMLGLYEAMQRKAGAGTTSPPPPAPAPEMIRLALEAFGWEPDDKTELPYRAIFVRLGQAFDGQPDVLWLVARGLVRADWGPTSAGPPTGSSVTIPGLLLCSGAEVPVDTQQISPSGLKWIGDRVKAIGTAGPAAAEWPQDLLLSIILGNTWENLESVEPLCAGLSAVGVPIKAWLLEYEEHLYNAWGQETYEPIFHLDYLVAAANAMWDLSVGVFAHNSFPYGTLAAQMRDPDVRRVKKAVRRISIVCTSPDGEDGPLWVGQDQWRWIARPRDPGAGTARCRFTSIDTVRTALKSLRSPYGDAE